jgi:hypothetical protein
MEPINMKDIIKQLKATIGILESLKRILKLRKVALDLIYKIETATAGESEKELLKRGTELDKARIVKIEAFFLEYLLKQFQAELQALKRGELDLARNIQDAYIAKFEIYE